jgi:hypothetical protein
MCLWVVWLMRWQRTSKWFIRDEEIFTMSDCSLQVGAFNVLIRYFSIVLCRLSLSSWSDRIFEGQIDMASSADAEESLSLQWLSLSDFDFAHSYHCRIVRRQFNNWFVEWLPSYFPGRSSHSNLRIPNWLLVSVSLMSMPSRSWPRFLLRVFTWEQNSRFSFVFHARVVCQSLCICLPSPGHRHHRRIAIFDDLWLLNLQLSFYFQNKMFPKGNISSSNRSYWVSPFCGIQHAI